MFSSNATYDVDLIFGLFFTFGTLMGWFWGRVRVQMLFWGLHIQLNNFHFLWFLQLFWIWLNFWVIFYFFEPYLAIFGVIFNFFVALMDFFGVEVRFNNCFVVSSYRIITFIFGVLLFFLNYVVLSSCGWWWWFFGNT